MLILLYGSDSYRRQRELRRIFESVTSQHPQALLEEISLMDLEKNVIPVVLRESLASFSLFSRAKIVIFEGIWGVDPKLVKKIFKDTKALFQNNNLYIVFNEIKPPPYNFKFLERLANEVKVCNTLQGDQLRDFIQEEAKKRGLVLGTGALHFLVQFFAKKDEASWFIVNEMEKLSLVADVYSLKKIDTLHLLEFGAFDYSPNFFHLVSQFRASTNIADKLEVLEQLFFSKEEPAKIFNFLASNRFLPLAWLERLADYDIMVKAGIIDYEEVLVSLALG